MSRFIVEDLAERTHPSRTRPAPTIAARPEAGTARAGGPPASPGPAQVVGPPPRHDVAAHPLPPTASPRLVTPVRAPCATLCLWLPAFELRLELVRSPELDATSVALLAPTEGTRRKIWQVSERAHQAGVRPGQLISKAVGLCPSLALLEPDPDHYDAAMETLLDTLEGVTPVVEPEGAGKIFLGMDGLERLHGPPSPQARLVLHTLFRVLPRPLVAATRAGYAPGKFGAWVAAARARPGKPVVVGRGELTTFLASQPISALPVDPLMIERLRRLGIATLGEMARFPPPALVAQFGEEGREALAWATGRRIDPPRPRHHSLPIRASIDFPAPVGLVETLHGALDSLLERALSRPARRGRSVLAARLRARLEKGGSWGVEAALRSPTASRERLAFVLRSRMALSPPPRAVETLGVELFRFGPPSSQAALFDPKKEGEAGRRGSDPAGGEAASALRKAVHELELKLGSAPLYRVVEMDPWSRIPERRHALLSFDP